jgi:hypothetical protein
MKEIVASIQRVTDIMGEITQASQEQTAGLDQIHQAISQIDSITQQNVTLVHEATEAANSLEGQASALSHVVGVFHLDAMPVKLAPAPAPLRKPAERIAAPVKRTGAVRPAAKKAPAIVEEDWETF